MPEKLQKANIGKLFQGVPSVWLPNGFLDFKSNQVIWTILK